VAGGEAVPGRGGHDAHVGVGSGGGQVGEELLVGEGDHHGGGGAAVLRQTGVGEVLQQGAERLTAAAGCGEGADFP